MDSSFIIICRNVGLLAGFSLQHSTINLKSSHQIYFWCVKSSDIFLGPYTYTSPHNHRERERELSIIVIYPILISDNGKWHMGCHISWKGEVFTLYNIPIGLQFYQTIFFKYRPCDLGLQLECYNNVATLLPSHWPFHLNCFPRTIWKWLT